jgi:hypothetical protein
MVLQHAKSPQKMKRNDTREKDDALNATRQDIWHANALRTKKKGKNDRPFKCTPFKSNSSCLAVRAAAFSDEQREEWVETMKDLGVDFQTA